MLRPAGAGPILPDMEPARYRFTASPTPAYAAAVDALRSLLEESGDERAVTDAWAEVAASERLRIFAGAGDSAMAECRGQPCALRLTPGGCGEQRVLGLPADEGFDDYLAREASGHRADACDCITRRGRTDHPSLWEKGGRPDTFVAQPYDLGIGDLRELVSFCDRHGLDCSIGAAGSWHQPGRTLLLVIRRAEGNAPGEPAGGATGPARG